MLHIEHAPNEQGPQKFNSIAGPNMLQAEIIRRYAHERSNSQGALLWIDTHAEKFREIIAADPSLLSEWENAPDTVIEKIEAQLYAKRKEAA